MVFVLGLFLLSTFIYLRFRIYLRSTTTIASTTMTFIRRGQGRQFRVCIKNIFFLVFLVLGRNDLGSSIISISNYCYLFLSFFLYKSLWMVLVCAMSWWAFNMNKSVAIFFWLFFLCIFECFCLSIARSRCVYVIFFPFVISSRFWRSGLL